ncbi:DUF2520 domain-containing protein [Mobilicoccus pelagius]|uniref:DUF2520 domain-containing protein n=1 Tax=Mobilicoccus pelagius NBRC 104925 TaxID=1089455 RepID=H5UTL6_9MICO|nr:DUF2520 domain-containing protein [Mobilicoccus pelagius]GAB49074.1 hypothetical protein MOPEL_096_00810 [Mobilicoccus pelagius NBRC 104925]
MLTVDDLAAAGLPGCLTGPAVRGDVGAVAAHLDALDEESRALDAATTRALLPSAARVGVAGATFASLEALLGPR